MNPNELLAEMVTTSKDLQTLIDGHPVLVQREVEANKLATLAEATTRVSTLADDRLTGVKRSVAEYDAIVARNCLDERYKADLARGLRESNKLAINAAMSKLSALQSMASALREEIRFSRTGPEMMS